TLRSCSWHPPGSRSLVAATGKKVHRQLRNVRPQRRHLVPFFWAQLIIPTLSPDSRQLVTAFGASKAFHETLNGRDFNRLADVHFADGVRSGADRGIRPSRSNGWAARRQMLPT